MFVRRNLTAVILILGSVAVAFAQQPQNREPDGRRHERHERMDRSEGPHGRIGHQREEGLRALRELNLTEEQSQQQKTIMQRHLDGINSQREELSKLREKRMKGTFSVDDEARAKALRQEIESARRSMLTEIEGTLTADQRAKLEQIKSERKLQHEEMRKRRSERQGNPQQ